MSRVKIRAALETALAAMTPAVSTAFQNVAFTPVANVPYQKAEFLWARPTNDEFGSNWRQDGICQVTLRYPANAGPGAAGARADLITATFKRGNSYTSSGVTVVISDTPEEMPGYDDADRWAVPVRIRFYAHLTA